MTFNIFIPSLFGYSVFIELLNDPFSGKLLEWEHTEGDTEIWLVKRIHLIVSDERYYRRLKE